MRASGEFLRTRHLFRPVHTGVIVLLRSRSLHEVRAFCWPLLASDSQMEICFYCDGSLCGEWLGIGGRHPLNGCLHRSNRARTHWAKKELD